MGGAAGGGCASCSKLRVEPEAARAGGGEVVVVVLIIIVLVVVFISPPSDAPGASMSSAGKDRARDERENVPLYQPLTCLTPGLAFNHLSQQSRPFSPARPRHPPPEPRTPAPGLQGSRLSMSSKRKTKIKSLKNYATFSLPTRERAKECVCVGLESGLFKTSQYTFLEKDLSL